MTWKDRCCKTCSPHFQLIRGVFFFQSSVKARTTGDRGIFIAQFYTFQQSLRPTFRRSLDFRVLSVSAINRGMLE